MISTQRFFLICLLGCLALITEAFAPAVMQTSSYTAVTLASPSALKASPLMFESTILSDASSNLVAAATLDPTTFLSDLLGGFISSNLILAVPIVAALGLASLVAFLIVAYANPAEPNDDEY